MGDGDSTGLPDQFFQCVEVLAEGFPPGGGNRKRSVGFFADELFVHLHVAQFFQRRHVAGKVAVGDLQLFLQCAEVHGIVHQEHRHDAQPHPAVERFM